MSAVIGGIIAVLIVLLLLSACINSISKSVQRFQGQNRCSSCKSRLKAANGRYATTCRKCGARQPWADPFMKAMKGSKLTLLDSERATYAGPVTFAQQTGTLVLTDHRLHFTPRRGGAVRDVPLAEVVTVLRLTDVAGFAVETVGGQKHLFRTSPGTEWYDRTLAAANAPAIRTLRSQRREASAGS